MMQIAQDKHCWLSDLDDVPSDELELWVAYYDLENQKRKREQAKSEQAARRRR